ILARDVVGDDRHGVRPIRATERVGVGVVCGGVLRDQGCLPVARCLGRRRAPAPRRERNEQRCRGCGRPENECELSHRPVAPFRDDLHVGADSQRWLNRFGPMREYPAMPRSFAHLSDEAIVALVARSDQEALGELYDRFGRVAYGLALRVLRDEKLAEDAVQEGFLAAWRNADRFMPERAKASSWLLTLVHRRAVDLVRREERRRAEPLPAASEGAASDSAEEDAWLRFERERVQAALRQLPDQQREALELAYYGGFSQSELAERLGQPIGTIKSRMFAGLARLRELL